MSELKEYLAPLVMPQKKIRPLLKSLKSSWSILIHGVLPHHNAVQPEKLFVDEHIGSEQEYMAELAMELYKESTARIDGLEEKGFKLLTYISAISAISVYFIGKELDGFFKYTVIASLLFLVVAIVISLRCIGIKQQKALFIDSLFKFEADAAPSAQSKKAIIASLINCAVFNQAVSDNTADILRASRFMLSIGIWTTALSCVFFLYKSPDKAEMRLVKFSDSTYIHDAVSNLKIQSQLNAAQEKLNLQLKTKLDSLEMITRKYINEKPGNNVSK